MFRKIILAAGVLALIVSVASPAFAGGKKSREARVAKWKHDVKACLIEHKVKVTGERPECYLSDELRLLCLTPELGKIAAKCNEKHLPGPTHQAKW